MKPKIINWSFYRLTSPAGRMHPLSSVIISIGRLRLGAGFWLPSFHPMPTFLYFHRGATSRQVRVWRIMMGAGWSAKPYHGPGWCADDL